MSLEWRNRARERRLKRRQARKLFKSQAKQPPQVYAAYLDGLVRGACLREAHEARIDDIAMFDIFGQAPQSLIIEAAAVTDDDDDDEFEPAPAQPMVLH